MSETNATKISNITTQSQMLVRAIEKEETKKRAATMATLHKSGHSCLTCAHTKTGGPSYLNCNLKHKRVKPYNICENHKKIEFKKKIADNA